MLPTMSSSGDLVVISRLSRTFHRGDVVVATSPTNPRTKLCKRIIGLPGDSITLLPLTPTPSSFTPPLTTPPSTLVVPPGHVFLQGDNVANSSDSRHYGPVPMALVMGRVVAKVWPVREWGPVERTMRWSGQPQWQGEGGERGEKGGRRGRGRGRQRDEEAEGIGPRLPGRSGVQVLAESPQVVEAPAGEQRQPQVTIIPFTPAAKRDRKAEG